MEGLEGVLQVLLADVGVAVGGGDAGVAEHFLDDAQVGAVFEKVGGEGVAERVWRDRPGDAGDLGVAFDAPKNLNAIDASTF